MLNVSGVSPFQFVYGRNPRVPSRSPVRQSVPCCGRCCSDRPPLDVAARICLAARQAVVATQDSKVIREALRARPRLRRTFELGQLHLECFPFALLWQPWTWLLLFAPTPIPSNSFCNFEFAGPEPDEAPEATALMQPASEPSNVSGCQGQSHVLSASAVSSRDSAGPALSVHHPRSLPQACLNTKKLTNNNCVSCYTQCARTPLMSQSEGNSMQACTVMVASLVCARTVTNFLRLSEPSISSWLSTWTFLIMPLPFLTMLPPPCIVTP